MQLVIYIVFNLGMDDISFFTYEILFICLSQSRFYFFLVWIRLHERSVRLTPLIWGGYLFAHHTHDLT